MVGENIMIHPCGITHAADIINKRLRLFADILTLQKRESFPALLWNPAFPGIPAARGFLLRFPPICAGSMLSFKAASFSFKSFSLSSASPFLGTGVENALCVLWIVHFINQFFKIIGFGLFPQRFVGFTRFDMDEGARHHRKASCQAPEAHTSVPQDTNRSPPPCNGIRNNSGRRAALFINSFLQGGESSFRCIPQIPPPCGPGWHFATMVK